MSELLVRAALFRRESRMKPFHYRLDHPEQDDANWLGMVHVRMADGKPELSFRKLG
jgi:succinate dehydrogenase/fumarate reductase flavoprotein subunit